MGETKVGQAPQPETQTAAQTETEVAKEPAKSAAPSKETPIISLEPKHVLGPVDAEQKVTYPYYSSYDPYYYSARGWNNQQYYTRGYGPACGCSERGCCPCLYGDP